MVREVAVDLAEELDDRRAQGSHQLRGEHAGDAVAAVDDHFEPPSETGGLSLVIRERYAAIMSWDSMPPIAPHPVRAADAVRGSR